jgi:hypothetical protein
MAVPAGAALLPFGLNVFLAIFSYASPSTSSVQYAYNAGSGTGTFSVHSVPTVVRFSRGSSPITVQPDGNGQKTMTLSFTVDASGNIVRGTETSTDLVINGLVVNGSTTYSSPLITGRIQDFGYLPNGTNGDFDFVVVITGGSMASTFNSSTMAVTLVSANSNFTGSFTTNFNGASQGNIGGADPAPCSGKIGDFVWNDLNGNGIQDPGEPGLNNVTMELLNNEGTVISTTKTGVGPMNQNGYYQFPALCTGTYSVVVDATTLPPNFQPSPSLAGGNTAVDSNGSPAPVTLSTDYISDQTIDFGFFAPGGAIGDYVWHDLNRDGIQEMGEPGINGVTVNLVDPSNSNIIASTVTGNGPGGNPGYYQFTGLSAGTYLVQVDATTLPAGFTPTISNAAGSTTANDSNGSPALVTLATNFSTDESIDFGYISSCNGAIGDFVWHDLNQNGIQDAGEPGIDGVTVLLLDSSGMITLATTTTGPGPMQQHGYYQFTGLCPATYQVQVDATTLPPNFTPTASNAPGSTSSNDSNGSPATTMLAVLNDGTGNISSDETLDFGFVSPCNGSAGDFVFNDQNQNGIQDPGEPGIPGVKLNLRNPLDNSVLATTTTDANGLYHFTGLCAGNYNVEVVPPAGYAASPVGAPGSTTDNDSNPNPSLVMLAIIDGNGDITVDNSVDFGFYLGSIAGTVYSDSNQNGTLDSGEPGISGVTVTLSGTDAGGNAVSLSTTSASDGTYSFTGLLAGSYSVSSPASANGENLETTSPIPVSLVAGQGSTGNNFGYVTASIAGTVFTDTNTNSVLDTGEPGIGGVTVTLTGTDVNNNPVSKTTTTAADGTFSFAGLLAGTYSLSSPATASGESLESTSPLSINLGAGQNSTGNNFGYITGSIAGTVYTDSNKNSVLDGGEPGIGGVTVSLTGTDVNGNAVSKTTTTAANGSYSFGGLIAGTYSLSSPATASGESLETASPLVVNLGAGQISIGNNFGYITGSIAGTVYTDSNKNSVLDGGEPGIGGVTVSLTGTDVNGNAVSKATTTAADGTYSFSSLVAGTYSISSPATASGESLETASPLAVNLGAGQNSTGNNFGYITGSIAGTVYTDSNKNSVLDGGEPGIGGVTVSLTGTDVNNNPVSKTTATAPNGTYSFGGLIAGSYSVSSPATASGESLETASPLAVNLGAGQNSTGNNFGYITGSIAGTVYTDTNKNSVLDGGEPGIGGVTVSLTGTDVNGNAVSKTTTTASNGTYLFSGLVAGTYSVASPASASGEALETTSPLPVNLGAGQNSTGDNFGYITGGISGTVYTDSNKNSVLDGGEPGIGGVTVTLTGTDANNNPVSKTTTTAANGTYSFAGLLAGSYSISVPATANGESLETTSPLAVILPAGGSSVNNNFGYVPPPLMLTCPAGSGQVGVPYSSSAAVTGGLAPYMFSVASGSLPPGLMLNSSTGAITGIPTAGGTFVFTIRVTDSLGTTAVSICTGSCSGSSITWNFATPSGTLGTSAAYTVSGVTVTAYGYTTGGVPTKLYGNNRGSDEYGLGINGTAENEIDTGDFVQLDLLNLINLGYQNAQMTVTSVQSGETYSVYGSNTQGVIGTPLINNSTLDNTAFAIPQFGAYRYVSVRATSANVILGALSATLPPGCTITITGVGSIAGTVYTDTNQNKSLDNGEPGIGGVTVTLTGTDVNGNSVSKSTTTAPDGTYSFTGLLAGSYSVSSPATANGENLETTSPLSVTLAAGQNKTGVNFGYVNVFCAATLSTIVSDFNGTSIKAGNTIWFSSVMKLNGTITKPVHINVTNASIVFTANGVNYTVPVPNATITVDPSATMGTTTFNAATNTWMTTSPVNVSGNIFLDGVALPLPNGLPGGVQNVSWSAQFSADTNGLTMNWQWAAAVFTSFSTNYNALGIKSLDDNNKCSYKNSDHAGTPENYKQYVVGGATGGGGSNYTGSLSGTASVALCKTGQGHFTTYTQGFWHNKNGLALLNAGFPSVYPGGKVSIGGKYTLTFDSPGDVSKFLPQGGGPGVLTYSIFDPSSSPANVFGGQVLTLQLNVDFSNEGITQQGLVNLRVASGPFTGYSVGQVLAIANTVLGGKLSALPAGVSESDLNNTVDAINNNFDGGTTNNGYLF